MPLRYLCTLILAIITLEVSAFQDDNNSDLTAQIEQLKAEVSDLKAQLKGQELVVDYRVKEFVPAFLK